MDKQKAEKLKAEGNAATAAGRHADAVKLYTEAISHDAENHVLWSNRSAAHAQLKQYQKALDDAEKTVLCKPDWPKGYSRKGAALVYMKRFDEAISAYEDGLKVDPNNQLLHDGLADAHAAKEKSTGGNSSFPNPFSDPALLTKLATNPKTRHLATDQEFLGILRLLQNNPQMLTNFLKDERVMLALTTLMGVDLNMADDVDDKAESSRSPASTTNGPARTSTASSAASSGQTAAAANTTNMNDVEMSDDSQQALKEKELGNAAYKKRDFDTALRHYQQAISLDPANMTFLLNTAAVYFEQKKYDECVEQSLKAVEVGRSNRADYKSISKAFARAANSYLKKQDLQNAKLYYEKALSEHRSPEVKTKLSEVERLIKEQDALQYRDPSIAEELRQKGNEEFKKGSYSDAVKTYSEAVRRNPDDPKIYSNRAACYTKLAAFDLGLKDCDKCIELDPKFIKGHIRKGMLLKAMKQFDKAMNAFQKAISLDESNAEAAAGYRECMLAVDNDPEQIKRRAMSDPDVQAILRDPGMRLILEQMQENPDAAKEHMKNPEIAQKIQKLLQCGLIAFR